MRPVGQVKQDGDELHHTYYTLEGHRRYRLLYCTQCEVLHKENLDDDENG